MSKRTFAFISICLFMLSLGLCPAALAATITVDTVDDVSADDGQCSLREAIIAANDNDAGTSNCVAGDDNDDTIDFDPVVFDPAATETILLGGSLPDITRDLIITGPGADALTIDGDNAFSIFTIDSGGSSRTLEISGLTLSGGSAVNGGAVFVNSGDTLELSFCTLMDNEASTDGGGIFNDSGTVVVTECDIDDNEAAGLGGGISNKNGGLVQLFQSTVSNNISDGDGGGIHNDEGTVEITDSTIWRNVSLARGSGIENLDTVELVNTTISGNIGIGLSNATGADATLTNCTVADNSGLGISNDAVGIVSLKNTIVADNNDIFNECTGIIQSEGNNLASDGSCGLTGPMDLLNTDPLLGPLQDNGGPTFTHALDPASPAIDTGERLLWITTDQRGIARPQDGNGDRVAYFDIGSYEFVLVLPGGGEGNDCFIATAAYGSDMADEVVTLRRFRDNVLVKYSLGRAFVRFYYAVSPPVASYIARHDTLRAAARLSLAPLVYAVSHSGVSVLIFFGTMIGAVLAFRAMRFRLAKS